MAVERPDQKTSFYVLSPTFDPSAGLEKVRAWGRGEAVTSTMDVIGHVAASEQIATLFARDDVSTDRYWRHFKGTQLWGAVKPLRDTFTSMIRRDMDRSGLRGTPRIAVWAGHYRERNRDLWHSDNSRVPEARWTLSFGAGSTMGALGELSIYDLGVGTKENPKAYDGDLLDQSLVGPEGRLIPVTFPPGYFLRFMTAGDIHSGPFEEGPRITIQGTSEYSDELVRFTAMESGPASTGYDMPS